MGTRGAVGFRMNDTDKVMYNHFDSYPEGLGALVFNFILKHEVQDMKTVFPLIRMVDERGAPPTEEDKLALRHWTDLHVSGQSTDDWYCLLRDAQGELGAYLDENLRYMLDAGDFLGDSLFCEWGYIVNLDTGCLEVYQGFNKDELAPGRYVLTGKHKCSDETIYYGVRLIDEIPFERLVQMSRDEYLKELNHLAGYDEED